MTPMRPVRQTPLNSLDQDGVLDSFALAYRLQAPIWVYDIDHSRIVQANAAACELWQADDEAALVSRDLGTDMSSTVAKRLRQYQADFIDINACFSEMWTLYPNGKPTSVMVIYSGFTLPDGRMGMLCEVVGDSEDEPQNLRSAEALLHTDVVISLFGKRGPALYMNPAARNVVGDPSQSLADLFCDPAEYHRMMSFLSAGIDHRTVAEMRTAAGPRWYDLSFKPVSDAATGASVILLTASDVSELKNARDKARYLADRDPLTGCYNRAFLQTHMTAFPNREVQGECALFYFDVDRFKQINDQFGHEAGDIVLKSIASRAMAGVRRGDIVARLGGDEFVILFEHIRDFDGLIAESERLLNSFSKPIFHNKMQINVTVSAGLARYMPGDVEFTSVLREADIALYASKQAGRNRATVFDPQMGAAARERDEIALALQQAVVKREFILHYQPRIDVATGQLVSVEGLVRWNHPTRGQILPGVFIPMSEETGLIAQLGQQVLEMGCRQAIEWHKAGHSLEVSLNISPRQFNGDQLMGALRTFAEDPGFPRNKIELEITESVLIGDHTLIAEKLEAITQMGYRIAIDDFGTGYSNLSYISRFPLNCLKIDRSFIDKLPGSGPIISLILTLGREIGVTTVAEGVETKEQLEWLGRHGCDQVQGYHLSRPLPLEAIREILDPEKVH